jgi:hypothetical protein
MSSFFSTFAQMLADEGIRRLSVSRPAGIARPFSTKGPQSFPALGFWGHLPKDEAADASVRAHLVEIR